MSGLKYKDARKQLESFEDLAQYSTILPLTIESIEVSAEIYAQLKKQGALIDDIDILIAGIAISNNFVLVTHNRGHFERINGLTVQDWAEK